MRDVEDVIARYADTKGSEPIALHVLALPGPASMTLRTRFWLLAGLRWLPTGFIIPVSALLPLERGLTVAEYGAVAATQGFVVLLFELPTGGFADALGRKPVFIASAAVALASYVVFALAQVPLAFCLQAR